MIYIFKSWYPIQHGKYIENPETCVRSWWYLDLKYLDTYKNNTNYLVIFHFKLVPVIEI